MALQVWLPFTKDWTNLGLDNSATLSSPNAAIVDGGKLGKCLQITGTGTSATFNNLKNITLFSVSVWVRNDATSGYGNWADIITMRISHTNGYVNSTETSEFRIERSNSSNPTTYGCYFDWYYTNSDKSASTSITKSTSIALNTWTHIVMTFNGEVGKWYFNGELSGSLNFADKNITTYKLTGLVLVGLGNSKSSINDLRIYDHCLSPEEVKEISKGLVLHYPLNELPINLNLFSSGIYRSLSPDGTRKTVGTISTISADTIMANLGKTLCLSFYKVSRAGTPSRR